MSDNLEAIIDIVEPGEILSGEELERFLADRAIPLVIWDEYRQSLERIALNKQEAAEIEKHIFLR